MTEPTYHLATVRGVPDVLVWGPMDRSYWTSIDMLIERHEREEVTDLRTVVLLDPAKLPFVNPAASPLRKWAALAGEMDKGAWAAMFDHLADLIEAAEPSPVEPTRTLAVIRDGEGMEWYRTPGGNWTSVDGERGLWPWVELPRPVTVLSDGWVAK